jgi:hypothetical protein
MPLDSLEEYLYYNIDLGYSHVDLNIAYSYHYIYLLGIAILALIII